ncbi:hypothetical protein [Singulisphaera sp. PoT]|uniref:hypothetical protein n=1 Tax=Singulisphaera sp. PoT TaxID=3411797 RepID=UPI003BF5A85B
MNKVFRIFVVTALGPTSLSGCSCDRQPSQPTSLESQVIKPDLPENGNVAIENVDPVSQEVSMDKVPAKVLGAAKNELPTVRLENAYFTSNEGSILSLPDYTLDGVDSDGKRGTVRVDVSGKVHAIDGPIPLDRVPSDIKAEAATAMPGVTFKSARIMKHGQLVRTIGIRDFYELEGVDARGKVRRHKHKLPTGQTVR